MDPSLQIDARISRSERRRGSATNRQPPPPALLGCVTASLTSMEVAPPYGIIGTRRLAQAFTIATTCNNVFRPESASPPSQTVQLVGWLSGRVGFRHTSPPPTPTPKRKVDKEQRHGVRLMRR